MKTIEQKAKKVPTIRFAGFDDEWVEKKLSESLILLKDGTHGTHQDAENGPLLLSAKNIKNGSKKTIKIETYKKDNYNNNVN